MTVSRRCWCNARRTPPPIRCGFLLIAMAGSFAEPSRRVCDPDVLGNCCCWGETCLTDLRVDLRPMVVRAPTRSWPPLWRSACGIRSGPRHSKAMPRPRKGSARSQASGRISSAAGQRGLRSGPASVAQLHSRSDPERVHRLLAEGSGGLWQGGHDHNQALRRRNEQNGGSGAECHGRGRHQVVPIAGGGLGRSTRAPRGVPVRA